MKERINKFLMSSGISISYLFSKMAVYATTGKTEVTGNNLNRELTDTIGEIISILFWIACFVCTLKIVHIGILYVFTGVEGKSKAKGAMVPWLVGAFICVTFTWLGPAIIDLFYYGGDVLSY